MIYYGLCLRMENLVLLPALATNYRFMSTLGSSITGISA